MVLDGSLHYVQCVPYAEVCRFFYCFAWSETIEFNRLPCPNNEMYGDAVFSIRFRYLFAIFGVRLLIWLSPLLHADIAHEIDTDKFIAAFFRISYCLLDLIRLNSIVCHDQTKRYTMMQFSLIDSAIIWLCLECAYWYGYLDSLILILRMQLLYKNHHW